MIIKNGKAVTKIVKEGKLVKRVFKGNLLVYSLESDKPYLNVSKNTLWLNPSEDIFDVISNVEKWNII